MSTLRRQIDRWLFEEYRTDRESLAIYRILFSLYVLLAGMPRGLWLGGLPPSSFNPPVSIPALFTGYPAGWVVLGLNGITLAFVCALLVGFHTIAASFGTGLGIVVVQSFCYADGKIDQAFLLALVPGLLACSGWGDAYSLDQHAGRSAKGAQRQPWLHAALAMLIGCALFTAGAAKIHGGWLRFDTPGTRFHLLWNYHLVGRKTVTTSVLLAHLPRWGWKFMDWSTALWESTFIFTIFRRQWFLAACAFGAVFHFLAWQIFDIQVAINLVAYGAVVHWARVSPSATQFLRKVSGKTMSLVAGAAAVFAAGSLAVLGEARHESISAAVAGVALVGALYAPAVMLLRLGRTRGPGA